MKRPITKDLIIALASGAIDLIFRQDLIRIFRQGQEQLGCFTITRVMIGDNFTMEILDG